MMKEMPSFKDGLGFSLKFSSHEVWLRMVNQGGSCNMAMGYLGV